MRGTLRVHPRGFAFLTPTTADTPPTGTDATNAATAVADIYIPAGKLRGCLDGDTVTARLLDDDVVSIDVVHSPRVEIIAEIVSSTEAAVDPGVGVGVVPYHGRAALGHSVVLHRRGAQWTVGADLGPTFDTNALYRRIMSRYDLAHAHEVATIEDAARIAAAAATTIGSGTGRRDLTDLVTITIDADHSRDLDDALSADVCADGSVRVYVHIADVASHVARGSAVDTAARALPTSVYLPMQVRPMLPELLADAALSLIPNERRDTLTVELHVSSTGVVTHTAIYPSVIRSRQRLSYHTVAGVLRGSTADAHGAILDGAILDTVRSCWTAASRIGVQRKLRGGVDGYRLGEDDDDAENRDAHTLVERLMVATNEAVATWLGARALDGIYRCHEAPSEESVAEIEATAHAFGYRTIFERPLTPLAFSAFADEIAASEHVDAIWDTIGGALERADYRRDNIGHFGLGSTAYAHFTSPLRRYADLVVHRIVHAALAGAAAPYSAAELDDLAAHITDVSNRSGLAERDARAAVALRALELQQRRRGVGVVKSIAERAIRVHVQDLAPVTGTIMLRRMGTGWTIDPVRHEARRGQRCITIGSDLTVRAKRIVPLAGVLELQLSDDTQRPQRPRGARGARKRSDGSNQRSVATRRGRADRSASQPHPTQR